MNIVGFELIVFIAVVSTLIFIFDHAMLFGIRNICVQWYIFS